MEPLHLDLVSLDQAVPENDGLAIDYMLDIAANPVPFSVFARNTAEMRRLGRDSWREWLLKNGYNAVVALVGEGSSRRVAGYIAWQRHDHTFHMFAVLVDRVFRGQGIALRLHKQLIAIAWSTDGVRHCQLAAPPSLRGSVRRLSLNTAFLSISMISLVVVPLRRWRPLVTYRRYNGVNMRRILAALKRKSDPLKISVDPRTGRVSLPVSR